jgi:hypothetical protein
VPRPSERLAATVVGVVVVITLCAIVANVLLPPRQSEDVAVPAQDATPEQVVATYLDALNAHDCDTAEAVWTGEERDSTASWCDDVASLTNIDIGDPGKERPRRSGQSTSEEAVGVGVTFDLDWRLFHDDGSMPEGDTVWGYLLVRDSPDAPWRIFSEGVG